MDRRARGFTLVEVIIALVIGGILTSIAIRGIGMTSPGLATRQARNLFVGMAARARAQAVESGQTTMLITNTVGDSVMILAGGRIVEKVRFDGELDVDIQASSNVVRLCMSPRGYANPDCNSFSSPVKVAFVAGTKSESVEILPLGQIRW